MLRPLITQLIKDLDLGNVTLETKIEGVYEFSLENDLKVTMHETPEGFYLKALMIPFPKKNEEVFATEMMAANLFGKTTRGAVIGLTPEGEGLTLTQDVDYTVNYKEFKEILEDFINTIDFLRDQVLNQK